MRRVALLLLGLCAVARATPELDAAFAKSAVVITTSTACEHFAVWLALDREQQARGLMHVRQLGPREGMLFVYGSEQTRSMWMKNTFIPLDMLFARGNGRIATIVTDTEPQSLRSIASTEPVRFVLELPGGSTEHYGISVGDDLFWGGDAVPPPSQD